MNDIDIFKNAASKSLPLTTYHQLVPYLALLLTNFEQQKGEEADIAVWKQECDALELSDIRKEYANLNEENWQAFARGRWPEIDQTFDLEAMYKQRNLPSRNAPWARDRPSTPLKQQ